MFAIQAFRYPYQCNDRAAKYLLQRRAEDTNRTLQKS